ncbi:molybdopterin synthase catalytic subunit [Helicobacter cappadocius]|uniref:Molybdopterin synthase catalytic subunit n=1 Tax=Helicobacter cappadocius TaxID=3063998 RepID=A0AA90TC55_9HELI|nr:MULTISPECIES: molybdenum cofactor biosynthesis protein MoaE [unclassified Helicobacter]MDO7253553.1 molybdenum cofactor biosynthesis protein MoaE [Helicobacter sp. faydin-H75]MDP2539481.1 molybdenum cofactor biosynthesis protein MoaE [Helicobacter sp. faydin-H76]
MLEIYEGALPTYEIYQKWELQAKNRNFGAFCVFTGIVREEKQIEGLSFDIYKPLLDKWFCHWEEKAAHQEVVLMMAHSVGDVKNAQSSYMSATMSSHRKIALAIYEDFIEDFKHNAPIWKYDLKDGKRIYAIDRSHHLNGSGILS